LNLPAKQAFLALSCVYGRANAQSWAELTIDLHHRGAVSSFFSAADLFFLQVSFSWNPKHVHAHGSGTLNRWIAASMVRTIGPVTATSASWKVMPRALAKAASASLD
jgi:hypothetical protein